jgi:hypothetical protein
MSPTSRADRHRGWRLGGLASAALLAIGLAGCGGGSTRATSAPPAASGPTVASVDPDISLPTAVAPGVHAVTQDDSLTNAASHAAQATPSGGAGALADKILQARNGSVIHLAGGSYGKLVLTKPRQGWVTVSGDGDSPAPEIAGAKLAGTSHIRFVGVRFSRGVKIGSAQPGAATSHVSILNTEIACGDTPAPGVFVRSASSDVLLAGDDIHGCTNGIRSAVQDQPSRHIVIVDDELSDFRNDAIDLGGINQSLIAHDYIHDIEDPEHRNHNDGIQFFGNTDGVTVQSNVISNSRVQLIFIQNATIKTADHQRRNRNILISHNLLYGAGGVAVQIEGGVNVRVIGNTMRGNRLGSLWLRGRRGITRPTGTVIIGNIISELALFHNQPAIMSSNLIGHQSGPGAAGKGNRVGASPHFVNPAQGNFALTSASSASASLRADEVAQGATTSLSGRALPAEVVPGAVQPGDPMHSFGPAQHGGGGHHHRGS